MAQTSPFEVAKAHVETAEAAVGNQRRLVADPKSHKQDTTEAEAHLRELSEVLKEAMARWKTIESPAKAD